MFAVIVNAFFCVYVPIGQCFFLCFGADDVIFLIFLLKMFLLLLQKMAFCKKNQRKRLPCAI